MGVGLRVGVGAVVGAVGAVGGAGVVQALPETGSVEVVSVPFAAQPGQAIAKRHSESKKATTRPVDWFFIDDSPSLTSGSFSGFGVCRPDTSSIIMDGDSEEAA